ncbi:MAG: alpha/beta hydrolase [Parvularculaceae bacterium]|nr:alpha/beta hydrolase [Parvularculaceae bacterium]
MRDGSAFSVDVRAGLKMAAHHFAGGGKTPVICVPGLTRNAADFEDFAPLAAATGRDVFAVSLIGRGGSDYDPDYLNYNPVTYRDDVLRFMASQGLARAIFVGTSLGGIVTMLAAVTAPERIAAAIINDVGPELAPEGIMRIAGYVGAVGAGGVGPAADIDEAAARIRAINEPAFPGRDDAFWRLFARRTFRQEADGRWRLDYDPGIGKALLEVGPAPDLWGPFEALRAIPTLVVRGAISDLLTPPIIEKMRAVNPSFAYAEVAGVGHAPTLTEPDALAAIMPFLQSVD